MYTITAGSWLRIGILGAMFGAAFMFTELALEGVGPRLLVACRLGLGAILLLTIAFARGTGLPPVRGEGAGRVWLFALGIGVFTNALPFFLLSWSQQFVASGFAGVCMAIVPLMILPLAHFLVPGDQMNLRRVIGFLIGTTGVIVLIGPSAFAATGAEFEVTARFGCVAAALCYAIGAILTRLCPAVDLISLSAAALTIGATLFVPYALWAEGIPQNVPLISVAALLYLGTFPTGLAQLLLVQVIRSAGPIFMSLLNYQVPLWSMMLGIVFLGEQLPPNIYLALLLILSGLALSQAAALRRLFSSRTSRQP
ncbi:EamA-like transporter family protein [Roseovarius nanhaiticus]|uniref:EamA-like transporter family protein n=1 Tax=Roseovarius nanhaiticus TaxID=573024 RepID=A0A1N7ETM6_9RHOB|nr:DMT family transporter [Roseovarius nanhaiticus]SEK66888.1 EamA-like transporter family protein [Roseovarius nanhaiticus]SIR91440.1 EamA-like transporter family protein [Roseovarius nanhaiticus]